MVLSINTTPYYDDFNEEKKYLKILFRPGMAVQARELTQLQSILQNQIARFGAHVFKEGSLVIPGEIGLDVKYPYLKLEQQFSGNDIVVANFLNKTITGKTSGCVATVLQAITPESADPNTLFLKIETGNSSLSFSGTTVSGNTTVSGITVNAETKLKVGARVTGAGIPANTYIKSIPTSSTIVLSQAATAGATVTLTSTTSGNFTDGEAIETIETIPVNATVNSSGFGSKVTINRGVYFINGYFCLVDNQTIILEKYSVTPSARIGLRYIDSFQNSGDDQSLLDPASGSSNANATGADRYMVDLILSSYDLTETLPNNFTELLRVEEGIISKKVEAATYSELEKTLARRTYDESGDYVVKNFPLSLSEHLNDGSNRGRYLLAQGGDASKMVLQVEPGKAYVRGFEIEKQETTYLDIPKARETKTLNNQIISTAYGQYVFVTDILGLPNITTYETISLRSATRGAFNASPAGSEIGTAKVRGIEYVSGTVGTSGAIYKLWLFDIQLTGNFSNIRSFTVGTPATKLGNVVLTSGNAILEDANRFGSIVQIPQAAVKTLKDSLGNSDTTYIVRRTYTGTMSGTTITLTAGTNEIFRSGSNVNYQIVNNATGVFYDLSSGVTLGGSPTGKQVTISVPSIPSNASVTIYATLTKTTVLEKSKTLATRTQTIAHSSTIQLDKADGFRLVSVTDASSNDVTDRYIFDDGQRDTFYDRCRLIFNSAYPAPAGNVTIVYEYFTHGTGDFFSVDSYNGVISYEDIPIYTSKTTGSQYDLANSLDFRPRISDAGGSFSSTSELVISGEDIQLDYEHYLPRIDKLFLDKNGVFSVLQGVSGYNVTAPATPIDGIAIADLIIPPYTYTPKDVAVSLYDNRRYTMRDIGKLEKRIENLEYYTQLSLLEKDTESMFIPDGSGNDRFKNGFIVDSFKSHGIGDSGNSKYRCSIDKNRGVLRPQFSTDSVPLVYVPAESTNITKTGDLLTLPYTVAKFITQPFASKTENVNPYDVFNWISDLKLNPIGDEWYETKQAPDRIINNDDGLADSLASLNGQVFWNDWETSWVGSEIGRIRDNGIGVFNTLSKLTPAQSAIVNRNYGLGGAPRFRVESFTGSVIPSQIIDGNQISDGLFQRIGIFNDVVSREVGQTRTGTRLSVQVSTNTQTLGDRIIETTSIPYIRSKLVSFSCNALKPNTRVYPFFDGIDVSAYCRPVGGAYGAALISDSLGALSGEFNIPNTTSIRFRTGQRVLKLVDNANNDANFITTSAEAIYTAQGTLQTRENTIVSTRTATLATNTVSQTRTTVESRPEQRTEVVGTVRYWDPLAQTFLIDKQGGVFLKKVGIYFATKDSKNIPVRLQIRSTINGYPSQQIVPFGEVVLSPTQVNTSVNGTTATIFEFDSPVYLSEGQEYSFVLLANSNEYTVWCSRIGENDVATDERISKQPYNGSMFKSQNASTWTADQEQDIKFDLWQCVFNTGVTGSVIIKDNGTTPTTLFSNPLTTTTGSNVVTVRHQNHGFVTGDKVTLSGAVSTNGIPAGEINVQKTVTVLGLDSYTIQCTTNATATGIGGGSNINATQNVRMDAGSILLETIVQNDTETSWQLKSKNIAKVYDINYLAGEIKETLYFDEPRVILSTENDSGNTKSFILNGQLFTSNSNVSPVIDLQRASLICITNRINNISTNENTPTDGNALARYMTKSISLVNPSTAIRVSFAAKRPSEANIKVYYKVRSTSSSSDLDTIAWTEMVASDYPLSDNNVFKDYIFEVSALEPFATFAIKIVMLSTETTDVPEITDFRAIALAL